MVIPYPLLSMSQETCQAIAERLERLLNLRIVTEGTKTYDIMQDYLRITRGVTVDRNVYVWSREGGARITHEDIYNFLGKFVDYVYHFILFDNIFVLAILFELFFILLLTNINYLTLKRNTKS